MAVFDKVKQEVYADDPKIIVGGTLAVKAEITEANNELKEVRDRIESIEALLTKAAEQL